MVTFGGRFCLRGEVLTLDTLNRALLLENIHPDATARLTKAGYEVRTMPRALGEDELIEALQGVSLLGIRSQTHVTERVLANSSATARRRGVLHRDQPGRSRGGRQARSRGVQRAVLQHPQRRRARDRRDHLDGQAAAGEEREDAPGHLGQVRQGRARGARPQAGHRRLREHRHPAFRHRREPRHDRVLLRRRRQAGDRERAALLLARGAAGIGRDRDAARGRPGGQPRILRRGGVRQDAAAVAVPQPVPRLRGRPRGAAPGTSSPGTSRARRSTCSRPSRRATARSSPPSCAG